MNKNFSVLIKKKIKKFNKSIKVENDKSISHRALLVASQCIGPSIIKGILESEDVNNTIKCLKNLGVRIERKKEKYIIYGNGLGSLRASKQKKLYAGNSGTLARMLIALISTHPDLKVKISGDISLNKRDMKRVIGPLSKIGCNFYPKGKTNLPLIIEGTGMPLAQKHYENIGSAQVKSAILLAALNTPGITQIEEIKKSRNHTENLLGAIGAKIKVKKLKNKNLITLQGQYNLNSFNLEIAGDPSSAAPFIVLTLLTSKSKLLIKNVNCNPTRIGFIKILKKMNADIKIKNLKRKSGELVGDIYIKSSSLKPIICPKKLVPFAIDEFPLLFIVASLVNGISKFYGIGELRHKESDRIKSMEIGLSQIGVKTKSTKDSLIIFGNKNIQGGKTLEIFPNYDHRIAMSFFCLGQLYNGTILVNDFKTVDTSFSKFLELMKKIGAKFEVKKRN